MSRVILVGCGRWGKNWANTLHQLGELAAICDPRTELYPQFQTQWPGVQLYETLDEALQHPGAIACVVATPVPTHYSVARQCLAAGKGVMVEKPLTLDVQESENLVAFAQEQGQVLAVGHVLMYHPAMTKLKELIDAGELGEIRSVQCTRVNLGTIRNEENVWWSFAPHDISLITLFYGVDELHVTSVGRLPVLGRAELEDTIWVTLQTPDGRPAVIQSSWMSPYKRHETVVIGTQKMAVIEDTLPAEQKLKLVDYTLELAGTSQRFEGGVTSDVLQAKRGEERYIPIDADAKPLKLEAERFIQAVVEKRQDLLPNDGENGLGVVRILQSAQNELNVQQAASRRQPEPAFA